MDIFANLDTQQKKTRPDIFKALDAKKSGEPQPTKLKGLVDTLVVKPITKMSEVWQKPQTPKGWKLAFGSDEPAQRAWDTWSTTIDDTSRRLNSMMDAYTKPNYNDRFLLNAGVKTAGAGIGVINSAFAGVTGLFNSLTPVPVVGHFADGFNKLFEAVGTGASSIATDALYAAPLDDDTKKRLEPVVSELAALVGMAVAGRATQSTYNGIKQKSSVLFDSMKKIDPSRTLPVQSSGGTRTVPVSTSKTRFEEYNRSQGYEGYADPATLPVIEMGTKPRSKEPTIQLEPRTSKKDLTYEPIKETREEALANRIIEQEAGIVTESTRSPVYSRFQSETALKLKKEASEKGYTLSEDVPFQERMNMMENLKTADEYVAADPFRAERALATNERFPNGIQPGSVWKSLKAKAIKEGDIPLMERLSRMTPGTEAARNMKSFDENVRTDADPVEAIRELRALKAEAKNVDVTKEVKKVKSKLKREPITTESWNDFISAIQC